MRIRPSDWILGPQTPLRSEMAGDEYKLQFAADGTFQVTMFSDLHYAEYEDQARGPEQDAKTTDVVRRVLEHENQELVVLNGDLVSGYGTRAYNVTRYLDQIFQPMVDKRLPWATTFGNHDNQYFARNWELFQHEKTYQNSLTQNMMNGPPEEVGITNYYLLVYPASGSDLEDVPVVILWFFDSRGGNKANGEDREDWIDGSVVQWFEQAKANLTKQYEKTIPSLAFFHIPVAATYYFQENPGVSSSKEPGENQETTCWQGQMYDDRTGHDVEFMKSLANTDGLLATFSGHDHQNDWCFKWIHGLPGQEVDGTGVNLCYGRHSGYGGYGDLARGGRHIVLNKDTLTKELVTWIRLEDGSVPERVILNSTYGLDEYHPEPRHLHTKRSDAGVIGSGFHVGIHSVVLFLLLVYYLPLRLWK